MTTSWKRSAKVIAFALGAGGLMLAPPVLADRPAISQAAAQTQNPNVTVDPSLLSGIQFRNLSVFSRGGRVTAVAGVRSNTQL